ncbi:unnamed protein product [Nezara viridula]|uniref:Uncharacterized protein n=1 Tax=Nezara viridula TaxID=85310 RepID=A0A9P0E0T7_NEZVI|nr:unnamed protein product [Nezara viridula]
MNQSRGKPDSGNPTSGLSKVLTTSELQRQATTQGTLLQGVSSARWLNSQHSSQFSTTPLPRLTGSLPLAIVTSPSPVTLTASPQGTSTPITIAASTVSPVTVGTRSLLREPLQFLTLIYLYIMLFILTRCRI